LERRGAEQIYLLAISSDDQQYTVVIHISDGMSDCLKFRIICRDNIFLMGEQNVNCDPRILLKAFSAIDDIFFSR
ncbi:hypothetical protein JTL68_37685, partial [Pseudomonas aeruginosa]|nr:hypothetical protein [Pseudomonas aeruginosa]